MRLLDQALAATAKAPRICFKVASRSKAYKKRFGILREDFGSVLGTRTLQVLAVEPFAVVAALVALKEAATAFLLVHETLFYGCMHR